jgi:hypothetical protein
MQPASAAWPDPVSRVVEAVQTFGCDAGRPRAMIGVGVKSGRGWLLLLLPLVLACGVRPTAITECIAADGVTPICGFENPEDLAPLPGASWIVVSQFAGWQAGDRGSLVAYRVADGRKRTLYPTSELGGSEAPAWGSPDCPGPPDPAGFAPHGIDVDLRTQRLAAVVHGAREAVELFEIGQSRAGPVLRWRGCVVMPEGVGINDVAFLPDGGFVVTKMFSLGGFAQLVSMARMLVGATSGHLLEWHPGAGLRQVPGSEGRAPNGVAASPDGRELYFAEWGGAGLVRLRRHADGSVERASVELGHHPDNITWTRDGRLLVTGQIGRIGELFACGSTEVGTCRLPFSVYRVEPASLDAQLVLEHPATAQGAGTVALEVGDEIFIGTFDGDRIARAALRRPRVWRE